MAKKRKETDISLVRKAKQSGGSQGAVVSRRRQSHRVKLTGYVARRKSLPIGITWDTELPGFGLRKRNSGRLTWIVKHRPRGVQRMVTLGSAGVAAGALGAPAARAAARRLLIKATLADLPTVPEKLKAPLFADYAEEFWLDYSPHWKPSTRDASRAYIDKRLIPRFGTLSVDAIERADINRWRDSMADVGGAFNRSIPVMSVMMQYAEKLGYREKNTNPCRGVSRFKRDLPERYLSADEYRRLGKVLAAHDGASEFVVPALLMLIYTGARVSEIATLRWRYVQIPRLTLPDSKSGPKAIYLNPQAVAVLDGLQRRGDDQLVFPAMYREVPINLGQHWEKIRRKAALPDEGLVSPVFFIGSKQADASRELEKREAERGEWLKKKDQLGELHRTKEKSFGTFKRERAKLIASSLHLANRRYEAPALMQDFQTWRDESLKSLSADELKAAQETCRAETPMPELSPLTVNVERVGSAYNFVRSLCEQSISMIALEELQRHPDMLMWLKQGLEYHVANDLDECLFCGNRLTSDRRSTLDTALDEKVDKFIGQLTQSKARLAQLITDLEATRDALHRRAEFVGELQERASTSRTKYEEALALLISMLRSLERTLDQKIASPAQASETSALESEKTVKTASEELIMAVTSYNRVVERHNAIRAEFAQHKSAAEVSVRKHFIADAIEEIRGHVTEVADAQKDYEEAVTKIAELDVDIAAFQTQIREHGPAANVINALIEAYLGHGELKIHPIDEGYELLRHSRPIEGTPSEGEKTAIAISYFLSSIESDGKNLKDMIVVVDDPVSSLDTKALNYACALIRSRLATASQVIILTHNLQCMNEFKKAWKTRARPRDGKDPTATFLYLDVKKEGPDGERQSHFMEMSRLLREYDSEYHFLFKHVIDFALSEADYHDHSYMMPNVLRRVLDVFLAFKCPGSSGLPGQLDQLCSDHKDLDRDRLTGLERLAQVESHSDNLDDLLSFSSMTIEETKGAASLLLEMIETVDPNHLRSVKRLCRD